MNWRRELTLHREMYGRIVSVFLNLLPVVLIVALFLRGFLDWFNGEK